MATPTNNNLLTESLSVGSYNKCGFTVRPLSKDPEVVLVPIRPRPSEYYEVECTSTLFKRCPKRNQPRRFVRCLTSSYYDRVYEADYTCPDRGFKCDVNKRYRDKICDVCNTPIPNRYCYWHFRTDGNP
jgi:hypothetical protein